MRFTCCFCLSLSALSSLDFSNCTLFDSWGHHASENDIFICGSRFGTEISLMGWNFRTYLFRIKFFLSYIFKACVLRRYEPSTFGYYAFGYCLAVNNIHLLCMILCFVITCFYLIRRLMRFYFHTCVAQLLRWIGLELRHVLFLATQVTCFSLVLLFSWKNVWNEILQSLYVNNY